MNAWKNTKSAIVSMIVVVSVGISSVGTSGEHNGEAGAVLSAVPHLQKLLGEEMRAVLPAMNKIVAALPAGDWPTIASTATAIHNSFIMQQKLTAKDRELLHQHLPAEFIHLDQTFHRQAKQLHEVALQHDADLSVYYVSKMLALCVECHQRFATSRFPALKTTPQSDLHH